MLKSQGTEFVGALIAGADVRFSVTAIGATANRSERRGLAGNGIIRLGLFGGMRFFLLFGRTSRGERKYRKQRLFSWYETHFLVGRRGLCRLIYFSPKHNGRYTLYEACSFFWSFIQVFVVGLLILLVCVEILPVSCIRICLLSMFVLVIVAEVAVTLINDIGSHFDNNKKF